MQKSRKTAEMPVILILTFLICGLLLTEKRVFASPQGQTFNTDRTEDTDGGEGEGSETEIHGLQIAPYQEMLVGPQEIDDASGEDEASGIHGTADLEALYAFIQNKEEVWKEEQAQMLEKSGVPREKQYFVYGKGFQDASRQVLAMTAVCRNYTFYNRILCQWYADNLWNETYSYRIAGIQFQKSAVEFLLPSAGAAADWLGAGGISLSNVFEGTGAALDSQYKVVVILENKPRDEIYNTDSFTFPIPSEWDGWTEENRAECEELMKMSEQEFNDTILKRQEESLLDSPVPFYKQGSIEWGSQAFGGGTIASDACCPTAIAMVLSYFKDERITPAEVAARYDNDGYRNIEQGSYGGKMCMAAGVDYGLRVEAGTASLSADKIRRSLESGAKIVMSMTPEGEGGRYATVYHYVTLAGLTENGQVIVNNPGISTDITYDDMQTILNNQSGRGYGIFWKS
ncbi:C39 family peptidase [Qiania dongpingensis]|uniref:C39 family peptidase n=1 Tax=Qiania dongpingensis TaxID=2763669 RepID=A0A7G9G194_9FIRM|nr:C39 family peptidase [Qiania dongpingensis]QNM04576.1 C39 family peptidase [Qiania dongpingensis]